MSDNWLDEKALDAEHKYVREQMKFIEEQLEALIAMRKELEDRQQQVRAKCKHPQEKYITSYQAKSHYECLVCGACHTNPSLWTPPGVPVSDGQAPP